MPRRPPVRPFNHRVYVCGVDGCTKTCSTRGGMKQHMQKRHLNRGIRPQPINPTEMEEAHQDYDFADGRDLPGPDEDNAGAGQCPRERKVSYHPLLDGMFVSVNTSHTSADHHCEGTPCDHAGHYLPPGSPPPPKPSPPPDDYSPYESRAAFQLAEFLYNREQMSAAKINELLAIMASICDKDPPFHSHKHMYDTIDATTHGDSPWKSFSVTYSGAIPDLPPPWMTAEYDVWYRDPKVVLEHQLANPNFKGEIDYAAKVVIDEGGHREVCDLMSGQWAFEQSVSYLFRIVGEVTDIEPAGLRTSLAKMPTHTVQCSCQWFLVVTRPRCRLQRVIRNTTLSTSRLGLYTTMSAGRTMML